MTIDEASAHYNIPLDILREYESWGLCDAVKKEKYRFFIITIKPMNVDRLSN